MHACTHLDLNTWADKGHLGLSGYTFGDIKGFLHMAMHILSCGHVLKDVQTQVATRMYTCLQIQKHMKMLMCSHTQVLWPGQTQMCTYECGIGEFKWA